MIEAFGLTKRYGKTVALAGIDLQVPAGSILGFLGPNGAGKTTAIRILATIALPDNGSARVAGFDVVSHAAEVRRNIGVAAQDATLDNNLTGRQNLVMFGVLNGFHQASATRRAKELLEQVELADSADRHFPEIQSDTEPVVDRIQSKISRWLPVYPVLRILLPLAEKTRLLHAPGAPRRGKTIHRLLRWTVYRRHRHRGINAYPVICRRLGRFQLYLC